MNKNPEELTDQELLEKLAKMVKKKQQALKTSTRLLALEVGLFTLTSLIILGFLLWKLIYWIMKLAQDHGANKATWIIITIITIIFAWFIWLYRLMIKTQKIAEKEQEDA